MIVGGGRLGRMVLSPECPLSHFFDIFDDIC